MRFATTLDHILICNPPSCRPSSSRHSANMSSNVQIFLLLSMFAWQTSGMPTEGKCSLKGQQPALQVSSSTALIHLLASTTAIPAVTATTMTVTPHVAAQKVLSHPASPGASKTRMPQCATLQEWEILSQSQVATSRAAISLHTILHQVLGAVAISLRRELSALLYLTVSGIAIWAPRPTRIPTRFVERLCS